MPNDAPEPVPTRPAKLPRKTSRAEQPATTAEAYAGTKPVGTTPEVQATAPAKTADAPFAAPSGYEFVRRLGEGGMGVVFEARDLRDGKSVALKTISDRRPVKMPDVIRFLSEAEVQAAISHENVVRVFKVGEWGGRPYMIMEYLPGGSLADRLADSHPKPKTAASLVKRIARGVAAAHSRGIFHRDLKPGNILFDDAGEPKVADFGLAKRDTSNLTQTGALMGTPAYMAPEQANGKNALVGAATDVWALGIILYECLTGHRPFKGDSGHIALAITIDEPPSILKKCPDAPRDLERICLKCLEKDPKDRYPSAAELVADLEAQATGKPIGVKRVTWVDRTFKWARKRPTAVAIWGLATLAIVLGTFTTVALTLWQTAESERNDAVSARILADQAKGEAVTSRDAFADQKAAADKLRVEAETAREALGKANYFRVLDLAWRAHLEGNLARAKQLIAEIKNDTKHHGWEWGFVSRRINPESVTFETPPDRTAGEQYDSLNFTPDGKHLIAVASRPKDRGRVAVARTWNATTGKFENLIPALSQGEAGSVVVSYEGRYAIVRMSQPKADEFGKMLVFDATTGKEVCRLIDSHMPLCCAETNADGKLLAVHYSYQAAGGAPVPAPVVMPKADPKPEPKPKPMGGGTTEADCDAQDNKQSLPQPGEAGTQPQPVPAAPRPAPAAPAPAFPADDHLALFDVANSKPLRLDQAHGSFNLMGFILEGKEVLAEQYEKDSVRLVAWSVRTGERRVLPPDLALPKLGEPSSVVSADGSRVAVMLKTGKAAVFDLANNRIMHELGVHESAPNGRLALGEFDADGTRLSLWSIEPMAPQDAKAPTKIPEPLNAKAPVKIPDQPNAKAAATHPTATLVIHDVQSGQPVRTKRVPGFGAPAYGPDGRWRYDCSRPAQPGASSNFLTLEDDSTNRVRIVPLGRFNSQYSLGFSSDGRRLAISRDGDIGAIDLDASDEAILQPGGRPFGYASTGAEYLVGSDPYTKSESPPSVLTSYDARTGMPAPVQHVFDAKRRFAFHRDGKTHAYEKRGDDLIVQSSGEGVPRSIRLAPGAQDEILWCGSGRRFFTTGQGALRFWDAEQGLELWKRNGFIPTARVTMETDREAEVDVMVPTTVEAMKDGMKTTVTEYKLLKERIRYIVRLGVSPPYVSHDGSLVALVPDSAQDRQTGTHIRLADGTDEVALLDGTTGKELGRIPFETPPTSVVFSPDSKKLAMLCGDRTLVYDAATRQLLLTLRTPGQFFESLAFSPDGSRIATGNRTGANGGDENMRVTLWDAADGREIFTIPIDEEAGAGYRAVWRIDFHPQGKQLAISTGKRTSLLNAAAP